MLRFLHYYNVKSTNNTLLAQGLLYSNCIFSKDWHSGATVLNGYKESVPDMCRDWSTL